MATVATLSADASYETLTEQTAYLTVRCEARPLTASLAVALQAQLTDITTTSTQERTLVLDVLRAEVEVHMADEALDHTVDAVVNALLTITHGSRSHKLYTHFLKGVRPSDLKEPTLGPELAHVRVWVASLEGSAYPSLVALAPVLKQQVDAADEAVAHLEKAEEALETFRDLGARKTLVDQLNAKRKSTHGELGAIAHQNPGLPADFADRFFLRPRRRRKPTLKELRKKLEHARAGVLDLEAQVAEAEAHEKAELAADAQQAADEKQQQIAEAEQKVAAAMAALEALKNGD